MSNNKGLLKVRNDNNGWDIVYPKTLGQNVFGSDSNASTPLLDNNDKINSAYLNSSMSNPMTTSGDLIVGGSSGTPTRLAKGSTGQVLKVGSSGLEWGSVSGGMSNPMTTSQDIIVGGNSGTPSRLAKGNSNELLGVNSSGNLAYTKGLPYITTAPSSDNTNGGIILVVLDSEPSTYYDGYYYIITQAPSSSHTVTINAGDDWYSTYMGAVYIYDGQDNTGTLLLSQDPADKSAFPMNLTVSSGYIFIYVTGGYMMSYSFASNDFTETKVTEDSNNFSSYFAVDKDGSITINVSDFDD